MSTHPDFLLDATPGAREALAALDKANAVRGEVVLTYPANTRPLHDISRFVPGLSGTVREPLPSVEHAEFDRARITHARHSAEVDAADRAVESAKRRVLGLVYGSLLDDDARTARRAAAAERVAQIDQSLATVPMVASEVAALHAERIVAERFSLVTSPTALENVANGATVRMVDDEGRATTVTAEGVQSSRVEIVAPLTEDAIRRANR